MIYLSEKDRQNIDIYRGFIGKFSLFWDHREVYFHTSDLGVSYFSIFSSHTLIVFTYPPLPGLGFVCFVVINQPSWVVSQQS